MCLLGVRCVAGAVLGTGGRTVNTSELPTARKTDLRSNSQSIPEEGPWG